MKTLQKPAAWAGGLIVLMFLSSILLFFVEASVGHDGLLCELGYDKDGDGAGTSGCY
jgi:hypothetical protein